MKTDCKFCYHNENGFCFYHGVYITPDTYRAFSSLGFPHFKERGSEKGLYVDMKRKEDVR